MMVAILCWYILDRHKLDLDVAKILKYAMTHDFVERHAGDVSTFASKNERDEKVRREHESLVMFSDEFGGFSDLIVTMKSYEEKLDDESLFVWTVDKMQQLIMGDMDHWKAYGEGKISYKSFVAKFKVQLAKSSPYCREIFESLITYSNSTYYDNPNVQRL